MMLPYNSIPPQIAIHSYFCQGVPWQDDISESVRICTLVNKVCTRNARRKPK